MPLAVLTTTLYSTLVYVMAGLNTEGGSFPYFVLVMVLCNLVALSFCQVSTGSLPFRGLSDRRDPAPPLAMLVYFQPARRFDSTFRVLL